MSIRPASLRHASAPNVLLKSVVAVSCAYETVAITTGIVPTFTRMSAHHRALAPSILAVLGVHLLRSSE